MSGPAFRLERLSATLGPVSMLHDIGLSIEAGRWTSIVGPNGAGKSTILKVMAGLLPYAGHAALLGRDLSEWPRTLRAQTLSWLGQSEMAADDLTVYDIVMLGRLPHQSWLGQPTPQDLYLVEQSLKQTHAWEWRHRPLGVLSGGERQRVLLARVLAVDAPILLMDEPLANLDPPHQADWLLLVRQLVADGRTVVSVLHEISIALQADDLVILDRGRMVHHGASNNPQTHRALEQVFEQRLVVRSLDGQWLALPKL